MKQAISLNHLIKKVGTNIFPRKLQTWECSKLSSGEFQFKKQKDEFKKSFIFSAYLDI